MTSFVSGLLSGCTSTVIILHFVLFRGRALAISAIFTAKFTFNLVHESDYHDLGIMYDENL